MNLAPERLLAFKMSGLTTLTALLNFAESKNCLFFYAVKDIETLR